MSQERIASIVKSRLTVPGYVPPVSEVRLGMLAAAVGIAPNASWTASMLAGWRFGVAQLLGGAL